MEWLCFYERSPPPPPPNDFLIPSSLFLSLLASISVMRSTILPLFPHQPKIFYRISRCMSLRFSSFEWFILGFLTTLFQLHKLYSVQWLNCKRYVSVKLLATCWTTGVWISAGQWFCSGTHPAPYRTGDGVVSTGIKRSERKVTIPYSADVLPHHFYAGSEENNYNSCSG